MDAALKGIVSDIINDEYAPYTESNPDHKIDACLSAIGMYKRMCMDILKVGGMNKIVIEKGWGSKLVISSRISSRIMQEGSPIDGHE